MNRNAKRAISSTLAMLMAMPIFPSYATETEGKEIHVYAQGTAQGNNYTSLASAMENAESGDTILLHQGIYRETLEVTQDNITIKNYENDEVYITGMEILGDWEPATMENGVEGVYVTDAPEFSLLQGDTRSGNFTQILANGVYQDMARFPDRDPDVGMMEPMSDDGGYGDLRDIYRNADEDSHVTFLQDVPDVDLEGGIFRGLIGKNRNYTLGFVTETDENEIWFDAVSNNEWQTSSVAEGFHLFGFGFISHLNLLDQAGEWFVEDGKAYYMPPADTDIEDLNLEIQVREQVLVVNDRENITIEGIEFYGGCAQIHNTNYLDMDDCVFNYLAPFYMDAGYGDGANEHTGIHLSNSMNNSFENVYVGHTWGSGFTLRNSGDNEFINCIMEDIGWIGTFTSGIYINADGMDNLVQHCTFKDNGRFQIRVQSSGKVDILDSIFEGSMKMGEDAGPLEFTSTGSHYGLDLDGSEIAYNVVYEGQGIPVHAGQWYMKQFVKAFYMEDTDNYTAHHNLVYGFTADEDNKLMEEFGETLQLESGLIYLGPRYNEMEDTINFYNNTAYSYDTNVNIWHIQMWNTYVNETDDYSSSVILNELDPDYTHNGGWIKDINFANNLFLEAPCKVTMNLHSATATASSAVTANEEDQALLDLYRGTYDNIYDMVDSGFTDPLIGGFTPHPDSDEEDTEGGYHFTLNNNIFLEQGEGEDVYMDVENDDYRLNPESDRYDELMTGGIAIEGITEEGVETPSVGAFEGEGAERLANAGSSMKVSSKGVIMSPSVRTSPTIAPDSDDVDLEDTDLEDKDDEDTDPEDKDDEETDDKVVAEPDFSWIMGQYLPWRVIQR